MAVALERPMFEFSRAAEYFGVRGLQAMTGQPSTRFADVILKELLDNGLDAAEGLQVAPNLTIDVRHHAGLLRISVEDNGSGIKPDTVELILNFQTVTSDKAAHRTPTRGLQGNAWKTIVGIPPALGCPAPIVIEAHATRHVVRAWIDPAGEVRVEHPKEAIPARTGTRVTVPLPTEGCSDFAPEEWARACSLFNPHATVQIRQPRGDSNQANGQRSGRRKTTNLYQATVDYPDGPWRKFSPRDLPSPWWYDEAALGKLIFAYIANGRAGGKDLPLRAFVRQFRGLSRTDAAKTVCDQFPATRRLSDFEAHPEAMAALLSVMRETAAAPSPSVLGRVGRAHFETRFREWFGLRRFWYKADKREVDGLPFIVEMALAETERPGRLFHAVNFSPTFEDPLAGTRLEYEPVYCYGVGSFLAASHASPNQHDNHGVVTAAAFHLVCPGLEFLDKGKTRLKIPEAVQDTVAAVLWSTAKTLRREGERRLRDAARQDRVDREREREKRAQEWDLCYAVYHVMVEAVQETSGGQAQVSAHTLFYVVRRMIQRFTSKTLTSNYFEQTLLPDYQKQHGPLMLQTPDGPIPAVYYEPRGTLYEPHTGVAIPLGTREVERYRFPAHLYDKILFIEKCGLWPALKAARLAEKYDMAIVAGEGYATEACRILFANADRARDYQIFTVHDADPHGYNIYRTLGEATRRMPEHSVKVIDLGLRLEEALALDLEAEEFTRKKALPSGLELTALELEYFTGRQKTAKSWIARRVELNAFTAPALITYIERKLHEAGVRPKVVPPPTELPGLTDGLYRDSMAQVVNEELSRLLNIDQILQRMSDRFGDRLPLAEAGRWIADAFADDPETSWRGAVRARLGLLLADPQLDLAGAVRAEVLAQLQTQTG
jgi:hypothetical protein